MKLRMNSLRKRVMDPDPEFLWSVGFVFLCLSLSLDEQVAVKITENTSDICFLFNVTEVQERYLSMTVLSLCKWTVLLTVFSWHYSRSIFSSSSQCPIQCVSHMLETSWSTHTHTVERLHLYTLCMHRVRSRAVLWRTWLLVFLGEIVISLECSIGCARVFARRGKSSYRNGFIFT